MGCTQSKIENEEAVSRCKGRKQFMKEAVSARNAFAAAHSANSMSLKNTGAALSDFSHAEVAHHHPVVPPSSSFSSSAVAIQSVAPSSSAAAATPSSVVPPDSTLPPPPPPLPEFQAPPLQRAASMPEMKISKQQQEKVSKPVGPTIIEDEEMEFEAHDNEKLIRKRSSSSNRGSGGGGNNRGVDGGPQHQQQRKREEPPPAAAAASQVVHQDAAYDFFFSVDSMPGPTLADPVEEEERVNKEEVFEDKGKRVEEEEEKVEKAVEVQVPAPPPVAVKKVGGEGVAGRRVGKVVNLMQIFADLDDHFLKASESAHEVSKMLEATRLHYHSNFADNRSNEKLGLCRFSLLMWHKSLVQLFVFIQIWLRMMFTFECLAFIC